MSRRTRGDLNKHKAQWEHKKRLFAEEQTKLTEFNVITMPKYDYNKPLKTYKTCYVTEPKDINSSSGSK